MNDPDRQVLLIIIAVLILGLIFVICLYRRQQRNLRYKREAEREVSSRRRISPKMKQYILERDDYTCQICGISKDYLDDFCPGLGDYLLLEIDHIDSVANGGSGDDEDNLQVLCWRCNRKKGGRLSNEEVAESIDYGIDLLDE
ncbi:MAG: HNH endonuclease [Lachnospiraceae bacterium]|nr:HNH endonuclease [Lachnospiraceae bacterium]